jgi:hypothetical protein
VGHEEKTENIKGNSTEDNGMRGTGDCRTTTGIHSVSAPMVDTRDESEVCGPDSELAR